MPAYPRAPHGRLKTSFKKSTYPEENDFEAVSATILVTLLADLRGLEMFVDHRVG